MRDVRRASAVVPDEQPRHGGRRAARADGKTEWLVSVVLPIEAASAAEAAAEFWAYVDRLGPRELPAFVWPLDDELAMQAYLLGEPIDLDPED